MSPKWCYATGCGPATYLVQSEQESGFEGVPSCAYHGERLVRGRVHPAYLVFVGEMEQESIRMVERRG